jgi:hypothetical protein
LPSPRCRRALNQKLLPAFGVPPAPTFPPISSASRLQMLRPMPMPPYLRVVELSACAKLLNSSACCAASMPMP